MARALVLAPAFIFVSMLLAPTHARADEGDDALFQACPGLKDWKAAHPRDKDAVANTDAKPTLPELGVDLEKRVDADQKARDAVFAGANAPDERAIPAMLAVDHENLEWLKQLVAKQGFPTVAQVGPKGVGNAFLLVQHADADPGFQASVLEVLQARLGSGGIRKSEVAMLTDRVLVAQGKPQRYGSQYDRGKDGSFKLKPTEDVPHLDERRAAMELPPSALYECALRVSY